MYGRLGLSVDSMRLVIFVHEWARLEAQLGREITSVEEFADHSVDSRRTVYRRVERFRREFGAKATPRDLIDWPDGVPSLELADVGGWLGVTA